MTFDALGTSLIFWEVLTFLILTPLLWLGFSAVRRRWDGRTGAREVLDQRYANGEIRREEYLTIRDDMTKDSDA